MVPSVRMSGHLGCKYLLQEDAYLGTMEQDLIQMAEDVFGKRKLWKGV